MAKKGIYGVTNFRGSKKIRRKGRHSKSPNKSSRKKPYVGQGRP